MIIQFIKPDFVFENETGSLKQLFHEGFRQVNVIVSLPGSNRGGHYHKFNTEGFFVIEGSCTLTVWNQTCKEILKIKAGDMFVIPPDMLHTFEYHERTVMVSFYSQGVEISETQKDIWTAITDISCS